MEQVDYKENVLNILQNEKIKAIRIGNKIRASAFKKGYEGVLMHEEPVYDIDELINIKGIGKGIVNTIKYNLNENSDNKDINDPEKKEKKEKYDLLESLTHIHGVGPKNAEILMNKGVSSIADLRKKLETNPKLLNDVQKKGLNYYEDILQRIPRSEIVTYEKLFLDAFDELKEDDSRFIIVGSYRRGAETSGDIDIFISSKNKDVYTKFIDKLVNTNIIVEVLSKGPTKTLVITKLNDKSIARRVDFLYTPIEEYPFAILYFTGSKDFNTVMRGQALKMGYTLNEHGISIKDKGKPKGDKLETKFTEEKDIFDFLELEYREPNERKNGFAVKKIKNATENKTLKKQIIQNKTGSNKPTLNIEYPAVAGTAKLETINIAEDDVNDHLDIEDISTQEAPTIIENNIVDDKIMVEEKQAITKKKRGRPKGSKNKTVKNIKQPKENKFPAMLEETIRENEEDMYTNQTNNIIDVLPDTVEPVIKLEKIETNIEDGEPIVLEEPVLVVPTAKTKKTRGRPAKGEKNNKTKKLENKSEDKVMKLKDKDVLQRMNEFKSKGMSYLETLSKNEINALIVLANKQFHSYVGEKDRPIFTDNEYDIVKDYLERKHPDAPALKEIGAPIEKHKVELPVNMPSMDKIKPSTNAVDTWKGKYKGPYVISCKLDGVSGLYYTLNGEHKLFTRGNGSVGQDVSHLLKHIKIPDIKDMIVRGEFIIAKDTFENKYKKDFSNGRNLVAGIVNSKKFDTKVKDVEFIVYEKVQPEMKPSEQMSTMTEEGFSVVQNKSINEINNETLSNVLVDWRKNYKYEIDGVIVSDDAIYKRANKNPDHSFAFKMVMSDQEAESKVVDVLWSVSKNGYLKPRVRIEPINIGGVKIEYATGFNGDFIEKNKIGVGALIKIIRSGDVIPYIKEVTTPAENPKMPDVDYTWTSTHVDIILTNKEGNSEMLEKTVTIFFTSLDVASLSSGNVKRLIAAGYNSICKILEMKEDDFLKVDGFKEKMAKKIYESIQEKMKTASLVKIMAASGKMGRGMGERKLKPIMEKYPDILNTTDRPEEKILLLRQINGVGPENAKTFVENIGSFLEFMRQCKLTYKYEEPPTKDMTTDTAERVMDKTNRLFNKKIVMTKVRSKEIIEKLPIFGAELENNISKNTFALITKSKEETSNKIIKAQEMSIPIFTPDEFIEKYLK